jgi:hypothetical protein
MAKLCIFLIYRRVLSAINGGDDRVYNSQSVEVTNDSFDSFLVSIVSEKHTSVLHDGSWI